MSDNFLILGWYGFAHFLVDAACAGLVYSLSIGSQFAGLNFFFLIVLYNVFAFGFQPLIGFIVDSYRLPRFSAIIGYGLIVISLLVASLLPTLSFFLAGFGNAFFHVGGGIVSLSINPGKATAPGLFVAPGALGLFIGMIAGKSNTSLFYWVVLLLLAGVTTLLLPAPKTIYNYIKKVAKIRYGTIIILLLLASISVRALVGMAVFFPWKSNILLLAILTLAAGSGKGMGGIVADKLGWVKTSVGALVLSIPFLYLGAAYPLLGIAGMLLFQMTMPVTLVALAMLLPGSPGFTFGLTTLALLLGALPVMFAYHGFFTQPIINSLTIVGSAAILFVSLRLFFKTAASKQLVVHE
ncbi:MFS transporter [Candidatus Beckwithbacteria bacterium]|nr:MFS transporter [Candidatus Beckwithbacteria bacterium]